MKVAITGTMGSGKSLASAYLRQLGYDVFDCDKVNRQLLEQGNRGFLALEDVFPECYIEGKLNKKELSRIVFTDPEKKKPLESILHPLILEEMLKEDRDPFFAEVPLLFEVNWDRYFDHSLLIVTDHDLLIQRLEKRGMLKEEYEQRLKNQMPVEEKIKRADKIIYNNGSQEQLYSCIDQWLKEIIC